MAAPVQVHTLALLDELVLTCRGAECVEQWTPAPIEGADAVVQLSTERCPACGSSVWEVTQVQVAGSPSRKRRGQSGGRSPHRASRSGAVGGGRS